MENWHGSVSMKEEGPTFDFVCVCVCVCSYFLDLTRTLRRGKKASSLLFFLFGVYIFRFGRNLRMRKKYCSLKNNPISGQIK